MKRPTEAPPSHPIFWLRWAAGNLALLVGLLFAYSVVIGILVWAIDRFGDEPARGLGDYLESATFSASLLLVLMIVAGFLHLTVLAAATRSRATNARTRSLVICVAIGVPLFALMVGGGISFTATAVWMLPWLLFGLLVRLPPLAASR
jgi:hypothetical protein